MRNFLIFLSFFMLVGCATQRIQYVPVKGEDIIEYRDTTIYIKDTINVPIEKEVIKEVLPDFLKDTSRLETSVAKSIAYVTENKLFHELKNKPSVKTKLDTLVKIQYVNQYITEPVIQEVPVEKPYIPKFAWVCIFWTFGCAVWGIAKIWLKFK